MKKKRTEMIRTTAHCEDCGEDFPILDTIRTKSRGRVCINCWVNDDFKMSKGIIIRQFDQVGYPPIKIKILSNSQVVKFEQGDNAVYVRFPFMDEFALEINEVKNWTKPKKKGVELEKW